MAGAVRAHRLRSAAACLVALLVVAGGVAWLGRSTSVPSLTAGRALTSPSTTVPAVPGLSKAAAPTGSAAAPHAASRSTAAAPTNGTAHASAGTQPGFAVEGNAQDSAGLSAGSSGQPAEIEQTGNLTLTVGRGDLATTMTQLTFLASLYNGYVANSQTQLGAGSGGQSGSISLEVPVDNFEAALKKAQALGTVSDLTTKATDVTSQYADLQARITALQASVQQYLTILSKATSIGDILAVQSQIGQLQTQIQQLQGQLQVLTSETAYSTLTVAVTAGTPPVHHHPRPRPGGLDAAWHTSVHGFADGVDGLVRVAGPLLFALLCLGALLLGARVGWRRFQRHNL
jgi:hypothetical protein